MKNMKNILKNLMTEESGQDLIEYALVVALIAFAATAGMSTLATDINTAFSSSILAKNITAFYGGRNARTYPSPGARCQIRIF